MFLREIILIITLKSISPLLSVSNYRKVQILFFGSSWCIWGSSQLNSYSKNPLNILGNPQFCISIQTGKYHSWNWTFPWKKSGWQTSWLWFLTRPRGTSQTFCLSSELRQDFPAWSHWKWNLWDNDQTTLHTCRLARFYFSNYFNPYKIFLLNHFNHLWHVLVVQATSNAHLKVLNIYVIVVAHQQRIKLW